MIVAFLDKISLDSTECDSAEIGRQKRNKTLSLLSSIVAHFWKSTYLKLLAPLTIYSGIEQAFVAGEFTRVLLLKLLVLVSVKKNQKKNHDSKPGNITLFYVMKLSMCKETVFH